MKVNTGVNNKVKCCELIRMGKALAHREQQNKIV